MKNHQRIWLWGELRNMPELKKQIQALDNNIDRYKGDLARMTDGNMEERIQGGPDPSPEIRYMTIIEKIDKLQNKQKRLAEKFEYLTSCLDTLPEKQKMVLVLEIQKELPRWRVSQEMRCNSKKIQRLKAEGQEQLLELLLGVMA